MNKQKTGGLIAAIRKEKGLTQEQLGEKLYVTAKAVSKWERGDSAPGVDLLEPLARELGISVTELLAGERVEPEDLNQKAQQLALQMLRREKQAIYRTILLAATVMVLAVVLVLHRWGPAIFQQGNPIPYLAAAARLTTQPYARVNDRSVCDVYISRSHDCPELFDKIEKERSVTFVEQAGSGFLFSNGADRLVVSSEIYWRYFVVWQVPTHTLQSP